MYKCPSCKKTTQAGEGQNKFVTEFRNKRYTNEIQVGKYKKIKESEGREIVKEVGVCSACYLNLTQLQASIKEVLSTKQIFKNSR